VTKLFSMLTKHAAPKDVIEHVNIGVDQGGQSISSRQDLDTDYEIRLRSVVDQGSQKIQGESPALNETIAKEGM
jgi:hypothetical protein